jgi:hypothetical protein
MQRDAPPQPWPERKGRTGHCVARRRLVARWASLWAAATSGAAACGCALARDQLPAEPRSTRAGRARRWWARRAAPSGRRRPPRSAARGAAAGRTAGWTRPRRAPSSRGRTRCRWPSTALRTSGSCMQRGSARRRSARTVRCSRSLRLRNMSRPGRGRVEIVMNGAWGSICRRACLQDGGLHRAGLGESAARSAPPLSPSPRAARSSCWATAAARWGSLTRWDRLSARWTATHWCRPATSARRRPVRPTTRCGARAASPLSCVRYAALAVRCWGGLRVRARQQRRRRRRVRRRAAGVRDGPRHFLPYRSLRPQPRVRHARAGCVQRSGPHTHTRTHARTHARACAAKLVAIETAASPSLTTSLSGWARTWAPIRWCGGGPPGRPAALTTAPRSTRSRCRRGCTGYS